MTTASNEAVRELGPMNIEDAPINNWGSRDDVVERVLEHDLNVIWPPGRSSGQSPQAYSKGFAHSPVVYHDDHDPEAVIETYLDANPHIMRNTSAWAIYHKFNHHYPDLAEALKDMLEERGHEVNQR